MQQVSHAVCPSLAAGTSSIIVAIIRVYAYIWYIIYMIVVTITIYLQKKICVDADQTLREMPESFDLVIVFGSNYRIVITYNIEYP